jgi:hypothetical protein
LAWYWASWRNMAANLEKEESQVMKPDEPLN